jgi:hypothetical protein
MTRRDDFPDNIKEALAKRAGYRCSFPKCGVITTGPSNETESSVSNSGMACHISAASPGKGARRYRPEMSATERKSISNGIWMCYTHGKLIDTDESRFTIEKLHTWKKLAELRARLIQEHGDTTNFLPSDINEIALPIHSITLNGLGAESNEIGQAIDDSCISQIWGEDIADSIRDIAIEICLNSFTHGKASYFELQIEPTKVCLVDDGDEFDILNLLEAKDRSGGKLALNNLIGGDKKIIAITDRSDGINKYVFSRIENEDQILELTPCAIKFNNISIKNREIPLEAYKDCKKIYIIFNKYTSYSDLRFLKILLDQLNIDEKDCIIFINASSGVIKELANQYPRSSILVI